MNLKPQVFLFALCIECLVLWEVLKLQNCKTGKRIFSLVSNIPMIIARERKILPCCFGVCYYFAILFNFFYLVFELTLFLYHVIHTFSMCVSACVLTNAHLIFALLLFKCSFFFFFPTQFLLVF